MRAEDGSSVLWIMLKFWKWVSFQKEILYEGKFWGGKNHFGLIKCSLFWFWVYFRTLFNIVKILKWKVSKWKIRMFALKMYIRHVNMVETVWGCFFFLLKLSSSKVNLILWSVLILIELHSPADYSAVEISLTTCVSYSHINILRRWLGTVLYFSGIVCQQNEPNTKVYFFPVLLNPNYLKFRWSKMWK